MVTDRGSEGFTWENMSEGGTALVEKITRSSIVKNTTQKPLFAQKIEGGAGGGAKARFKNGRLQRSSKTGVFF